jgi:hypothetical protein
VIPKTWTWTGFVLALGVLPSLALAEPLAGSRPAESLFFISRSENRNQVHYGIRLGEDCRPVGDSPVYVYWRMLERGAKETEELLGVEGPVYGLEASQQVETLPEGGWRVRVRLRAFADRPVDISVTLANGQCLLKPFAKVDGAAAQLERIFVKTSWPFSVDFVRLDGVNARGQTVHELIRDD